MCKKRSLKTILPYVIIDKYFKQTMARTVNREEQMSDMTTRTLTGEELARLNYLCFIEWGENLDGVRQMVEIARRLRRSNHKSYVNRKSRRKHTNGSHEFHIVEAPAMMPLVDYSGTSSSSMNSSLESGSPNSLIAAAERVRKALTPPDSPPKISYSLKSTPTPSPVTYGFDVMEVLPTGIDSSNYIRCKE